MRSRTYRLYTFSRATRCQDVLERKRFNCMIKIEVFEELLNASIREIPLSFLNYPLMDFVSLFPII